MQESGLINFESHTLSHEQLDSTSPEETWNQVDGSKKALEWHLGKEINFLAYPCGSYDEELQRMVKDAGYQGAFTVNYGLADQQDNRYLLDRVPIFAPLARFHKNLLENDHTFIAKFIPTP